MFISLITEGGGASFWPQCERNNTVTVAFTLHVNHGFFLLRLYPTVINLRGMSTVKTRSVQSSFFSLAADCRPAHCVGNYCCRTVAPTNARPANAESETARCGCYAEPPRTATAGCCILCIAPSSRLFKSATPSHCTPGWAFIACWQCGRQSFLCSWSLCSTVRSGRVGVSEFIRSVAPSCFRFDSYVVENSQILHLTQMLTRCQLVTYSYS